MSDEEHMDTHADIYTNLGRLTTHQHTRLGNGEEGEGGIVVATKTELFAKKRIRREYC